MRDRVAEGSFETLLAAKTKPQLVVQPGIDVGCMQHNKRFFRKFLAILDMTAGFVM